MVYKRLDFTRTFGSKQGRLQLRDRLTLSTQTSSASGIRPLHLRDPAIASLAAKMSWASWRKTTHLEDIAYSLIGLFDVNVPPLYGEGQRAKGVHEASVRDCEELE